MCTNYTNLNKACPKDPNPLLSINKLFDGTFGHDLLSFMDAYSRYNQIHMHPLDKFLLLSNSIQAKKCRSHLPEIDGLSVQGLGKVYVNDMVAKSPQDEQHYEVLNRIFDVLRKHRLKLNLEKCSFNVQVGKFLGYMLTWRGIKANLDKCEVVINMRSSRSLVSRITALSRFLSRSAKKALLVFQSLKRYERFQWIEANELAFKT
ncbi:hypothetical protein CR513_42774, partial [Mucuna pruriens]